ncbi:MAG: DHHA1 domain-containing protein [Candidatus Methanodesulfokora sp.]|jgi:oligoribonuclease NrnB/cAMP/cGMP phosphodiesterase (DHH superfamily)
MDDLVSWLQSLREPPFRILTHGEDLDGIFSGSLAIAAFNGEVELEFMAPDESKNSMRTFDVTIDLPPPAGRTALFIDHHASNVHLLNRADISIFDPNAPSSAHLVKMSLLKDFPSSDLLERSVDFVSRVDKGEMDENVAKFSVVIRRIFRTRRKLLKEMAEELLEKLPSSGEDLTSLRIFESEWKAVEREVGGLLNWADALEKLRLEKTALVIDLRGYPGYIIPYLLYRARNSAYLVITMTEGKNSNIRASVRSSERSPISALELASKFGGGGHERASGMLIRESDMETIAKLLGERRIPVKVVSPASPHLD